MKVILKIDAGVHADLASHLLPPNDPREQGAFLFATVARTTEGALFETVEYRKLGPMDFAVQEGDYLELADATRADLIKRAHDLSASLVEIHSHPRPWPAAFSRSDRTGLAETVQHMWWRLKRRPYLAIVVAPSGFDTLLWLDDPRVPRPLDGVLVGDRLLRPTCNSLGGW